MSKQKQEPTWNFEGEAPFEEMSETGINLCHYFDVMSDAKLATFDASFTDVQLAEWDGNFTSDGNLLLPCCETEDVDPAMYRRYIDACIRYRNRERQKLVSAA